MNNNQRHNRSCGEVHPEHDVHHPGGHPPVDDLRAKFTHVEGSMSEELMAERRAEADNMVPADGSNWRVNADTVADGCGNGWAICAHPKCDLHVVRPGKVQCSNYCWSEFETAFPGELIDGADDAR